MNRNRAGMGHETIMEAMPAFIKGKLSSTQQREIQEHIAVCPGCARLHQQELKLSDALSIPHPAIETLLTTHIRERNRERLLQRIHETERHRHCVEGIQRSKTHVGGKAEPSAYRGLATLAATVSAVVIGTLMLLEKPGEKFLADAVPHQTRSSASIGQHYDESLQHYRLVFQPSLSQESIHALLLALDAEVINGPSATGVYTVILPADRSASGETLVRLRQQPAILLAEKSVHSDR